LPAPDEGEALNEKQIDRLVGSVPDDADPRQRRRVEGYAANARRCERRIIGLRDELEHALRAVDDAAAEGTADCPERSDAALALLMELDALERVQPRIDSWLRVSAGAFSESPMMPVGEGPV
jgi:hypothetical protein